MSLFNRQCYWWIFMICRWNDHFVHFRSFAYTNLSSGSIGCRLQRGQHWAKFKYVDILYCMLLKITWRPFRKRHGSVHAIHMPKLEIDFLEYFNKTSSGSWIVPNDLKIWRFRGQTETLNDINWTHNGYFRLICPKLLQTEYNDHGHHLCWPHDALFTWEQ